MDWDVNFTDFIKSFFSLRLAGWLKICFLVFLLGYFLLNLIIFRQIEILTRVLMTKLSKKIRIVALLHVGFILVIFFLALSIL